MKKVISILAALAVLFACNPVEPNTPDKPDDKPEEKPGFVKSVLSEHEYSDLFQNLE